MWFNPRAVSFPKLYDNEIGYKWHDTKLFHLVDHLDYKLSSPAICVFPCRKNPQYTFTAIYASGSFPVQSIFRSKKARGVPLFFSFPRQYPPVVKRVFTLQNQISSQPNLCSLSQAAHSSPIQQQAPLQALRDTTNRSHNSIGPMFFLPVELPCLLGPAIKFFRWTINIFLLNVNQIPLYLNVNFAAFLGVLQQ